MKTIRRGLLSEFWNMDATRWQGRRLENTDEFDGDVKESDIGGCVTKLQVSVFHLHTEQQIRFYPSNTFGDTTLFQSSASICLSFSIYLSVYRSDFLSLFLSLSIYRYLSSSIFIYLIIPIFGFRQIYITVFYQYYC